MNKTYRITIIVPFFNQEKIAEHSIRSLLLQKYPEESLDFVLIDDCRIRKLTPTECERLQGFEDGWTDGQSDTQRYKQLGNAVSVPIVQDIAKQVFQN